MVVQLTRAELEQAAIEYVKARLSIAYYKSVRRAMLLQPHTALAASCSSDAICMKVMVWEEPEERAPQGG